MATSRTRPLPEQAALAVRPPKGMQAGLFGGGMKKGFVHGKTADERPCVAVEHPVTITDLHATLFTAMGISPKTVYEIEGRPFYATEDGKGKPVDAVFA